MSPARAAILSAPAAAAAWAFWPIRQPAMIDTRDGIDAIAPDTSEPAHETALASLDVEAFRAPLWVAPPAPPPPAAPPAPTPPLKLQLLAVVHDGGVYRAMLYDPDTDKVLVAAQGESLGARKVERVSAGAVQIRDGNGVRTLALRQDQGGVR